jgi:hypothetical protein
MHSTELEDLCTGLTCFLQYWNAFDRARIPLYIVGVPSAGLECFLEGWNAFDRFGIPLYRVGMLSTGLACFQQSWNTFVRKWNAF